MLPIRLLFAVAACLGISSVLGDPQPHTAILGQQDVIPGDGWREELFVAYADGMVFSGQPSAEDLVRFRDLGVTTVINLRNPDEVDWNEAAAVEALGMGYHQVPLMDDLKLQDSAIKLIDELVREHDGQKVLLHCRSGNRVAAWWALHLVDAHNMNVDASLELAARAGLTHPALSEQVRAFFN